MKIVDGHVHCGVAEIAVFGTGTGYPAEAVLRDMDRAGVSRSLIMGIPHIQDNDYIAAAAKTHSDRLIPWAFIDPWQFPHPRDAFMRFMDQGFKGIKFRAVSLKYNLSDHRLLDPWLECCSEFRVPVSMHTSDDCCCTPLQVEEMAKSFPKVTFILIHGGFRQLEYECLMVAARTPNIVLDHTLGTSHSLREALKLIGPDRIYYGSDAPFQDTRVEQKKFRTVITDPEVLAKCLGGTFLRIIGESKV